MALSNRDKVRLLVGDTDVEPDSDAVLSDEEIDDFLDTRSVVSNGSTTQNVNAAAADAAGAIAAKFGRDGFDFQEDGQVFNRSQRIGHYLSLEQTLRRRAGGVSVPLHLAGTETTS